MNKIKKKLLEICILTTISAFSINCFAMKNNNQENEKFSNNDFVYNPFNNSNFLNKKRNLEKPINKEPAKKQEENINKQDDNRSIIEKKKEKENEIKNVINNKIEESSTEENFESDDEKSYDELNDIYLLEDIETKAINLDNIMKNIKNQKNNLFIFFRIYFDSDIIKKMNQTKLRICKEILCYLIDKRMSLKANWNSHLNKHLLKNIFKEYADRNSFILGFCVPLEDNFMFPIFNDTKKENAHNISENFIEIFEDSKTKILKICSDEKDILNLKRSEFLEVMKKIFNILNNQISNESYKSFDLKNSYNKIEEKTLNIIKEIESKIIKDKNSLAEGIKKIYDYISDFLEKNKENIDNLKNNISNKNIKHLNILNKKMLNIFKYQNEFDELDELNELKKEFTNMKNEFKDFINKYYKGYLKDENKNVFNRTLNSLTLKELKEVINNIYSIIEIHYIDNNSKYTDYTDFIYPVNFTFNFELDILSEKNKYLIAKTLDDILKIIKKNVDNKSYSKEYIFSITQTTTNNIQKTSNMEFKLINTKDLYNLLFFYGNTNWRFKKDLVNSCITPQLTKEIPDLYANRLYNAYKKVIEDEKIDTKTLDIDKFLEEVKNYPLFKHIEKMNLNDMQNMKMPKINEINTNEEINEKKEKTFNEKLFEKIKEKYISRNKNICACLKNNLIYAFVGFQIDFMIETFAKNLKNRYSELIKKILTIPGINYNENNYKITESDKGILNLLGKTPQENYSFNFKLLLKNSIFENKKYVENIENILKNDKTKNAIIDMALIDTIEELKKMPELEFKTNINNHFEKNKDNLEKFIDQKNLSDVAKNTLQDHLENFIKISKKENFNINYLIDWRNSYNHDIYFDIQKLKQYVYFDIQKFK